MINELQKLILLKIIEVIEMSGKKEIYEQTPLRMLLEQGVYTKQQLWDALCDLDKMKIVFRGIGGYNKLVRITVNGKKLIKKGLLE